MAMFERTNENKVLRDPVHGYIHISYQVIWDCLNTKEFQRLRRIHQLGGNYMVYHTAEHSRFSHSLGVYEIIRRMCEEVEDISSSLTEFEKIQVMCAGLIHDLGHGPFSHMFENILHKNHEEINQTLILDENTQIHQALKRAHKDLPSLCASILNHTHPNSMLSQMISSQLDADRMDYLLRDAYETGTSYGKFDLERILRTLRVSNGILCIKESGMHTIEDYIMARYHMYWQVYLHPDARSYEICIELFIKRYKEIRKSIKIEALEILFEPFNSDNFYLMDENRLFYGFQQALHCEDETLKDLANRILNRILLDWIELEEDSSLHFEKSTYCVIENCKDLNCLPYQEKENPIWILNTKNQCIPLSDCSEIVRALLRMDINHKKRVFYN